VENAVIALTILPSLVILILAGLRPSEGKSPLERRQQAHVVVLHVLGLSCIFYLVLFLTRYLWPNLSAELYFPGFSLWVSPTGAILICSIFMGSILFVVGRLDEGSLEIRALRRISDRLLAPLTIFNRIELYGGERVWRNTVLDREPGVRRSQDEHERRRGFVAAWLVLFISLLVMLVGIRLLQYGLPASFKMLQEVATPLVFYWIPAELLLAATLVRTSSMIGSRNDIGWMRALIVVGTIFVAVFLLPIAVKDAGGLLAAAAVFISATVVLVASKRPLKVGLICLGFLVLIGASVGTLVLNLDALHSTPGTPGEARVRILAFRDGEALKAGLAWFSLRRDDATGVVSEQKIANAIEHTWENQAIAHEGRWWGLGFGEAPTRRSQVRQNTIQADSAFSFYVLSEYGFAGGLFLMVAYLVPLLLIVSEPRNSFGLKLAASIAMSFFLEAAFHALMNLGALPFTGRDLPLLAVNSGSDLWRWTILLVVLAHAATWQPEPVFFAQREAGKWPSWAPLAIVLAVPVAFLGWLTVQSQSLVRSQTVASIFDWSPMLGEVNQLALRGELKYDRNSHSIIFNKPKEFAGTTLLEQEVVRFNALTETEKIEGLLAHHPADYMARLSAVQRVEDWQALMNELREADTQTGPSVRPSLFRLVRVRAAREEDEEASDESGDGDPDEGEQEWQGSDPVLPELDEPLQVRANPEFNTQVSFDAAPEPGDMPLVRWAGAHSGVWTVKGDSFELSASLDGQARVKTVTLVPENGSLLLSGSTKGESRRLEICTQPTVSSKQKPCLGVFEVASSKVVFTPAVPGRKLGSVWFWKDKFALGQPVDLKNGEQVRLRLPNDNRDHDFSISESSESSLVGPAWVRGQWISTYDPDHNIPWTGYLSRALTRGHRHSTEPGTQEFDALTLDARLQAAAQRFTANRGQALYTRRVGGKRRPTLRLPPRVALSVIRIPDGRAVALGGWPRMSSETFWYQEAGDWVPPLSWVEEHAPASIRAHYGGDRNFDKMLMGSTTKPLWASVVLNLHPGLASKLMVRGPKIAENAIFGIPIKGKAWEAPYSYGLNGEWCDLSSYLAHSDNRYQVRLGTLALAERGAGGLPESETPIFSPSTQESMDGGRSAWRRYPRFPLEVKFNYKNPGALGGLPDSSMAERWRKQFGVGIKSGELSYRTSFWTRSEADDHLIGQSSSIRRPTSLLNVISPEAADLALDHIESPRQYINLLLGGGSNMWANVDFAAAFATAVTGQPTLSHITQGDVKFLEDRVTSVMEASMIQPGTNAVLTNSQGTAYTAFRGRPLSVLRQFGEVYGKTGTLRQHKDTEPVSRIVVAVVRWSPDHKSVKDGLVFSMVVERGGTGVAASWLADFVTENEPILKRIMSRN